MFLFIYAEVLAKDFAFSGGGFIVGAGAVLFHAKVTGQTIHWRAKKR